MEIVEEETDAAESCDGTPPMRPVSPPSRAASPSIRDVAGILRKWISDCCFFSWCFSTAAGDDTSSVDDVPIGVTESTLAGRKRKNKENVDFCSDTAAHGECTKLRYCSKCGKEKLCGEFLDGDKQKYFGTCSDCRAKDAARNQAKRKNAKENVDYCSDTAAHGECTKLRYCSKCGKEKLCGEFLDGDKQKYFGTCSDCRAWLNASEAALAADPSVCHQTEPHANCDKQRFCKACRNLLRCETFFDTDNSKFFALCPECRERKKISRRKLNKGIREAAAEAARTNPGTRGLTILDPDGISAVAASALCSLIHKFVAGSKSYFYAFQWSLPSGWDAKEEALDAAEKRESISHFKVKATRTPVLQFFNPETGECRNVRNSDVFNNLTNTAILHRVAISALIEDIKEIERTLHTLTDGDAVGFRGHLKKGGTAARQTRGTIFGVSILEIPDPGALNLVVRADHREKYEDEVKRHGGRAHTLSFPNVQEDYPLPPTVSDGDGGAYFVLGGALFEQKRGLPVDESRLAEITLSQQQSQGHADDDKLRREAAMDKIVEWDGTWPQGHVYFSGVSHGSIMNADDHNALQAKGATVADALPTKKAPMKLLVVDFLRKQWDLAKKVNHALDAHIPIISKEMFVYELMKLKDSDEMEE